MFEVSFRVMEAAPRPLPSHERQKAVRPAAAWVLGRSVFAVALMTVATVGFARFERGSTLWPLHRATDHVTPAERQMRADAFAAMGELQLARIPDYALGGAIDAMPLSSQEKEALRSAALPSAPASTAAATPNPAPRRRLSHALAAPRSAAEARPRLQLAWLTLWDTDAEDGDVVRIDSQGYSRTVTLSKAPLTFAVPVPADGVVRVTGVLDGDGGGVTVGLASGESRAVFPIMSVGQVLGLRVR